MSTAEWSEFIEKLEKVVRDDCQDNLASGQDQVILRETDPAARGKMDKVTLKGFAPPFFVVLPDKAKPELCSLLTKGECQMAVDALIFLRFRGKKYLLICDLKSSIGRSVLQKLKRQMRNSEAVAEFLFRLVKSHHGIQSKGWNVRYVVITPRTLKKPKTRQDGLKSGTSIDRPKEIAVLNGATVEIGKLCQPFEV